MLSKTDLFLLIIIIVIILWGVGNFIKSRNNNERTKWTHQVNEN